MNQAGIPVKLGDHEYRVVPQRHAYLRRRLSDQFSALGDLSEGDGDLLSQVTQSAYELLSVFIPDLMPKYEFEGFASELAMQNDQYDQEQDHSPSPDQIIAAFEAALKVNRLDLLKHLKGMLGEDFFNAQLRASAADLALRAQGIEPEEPTTSLTSPSNPSANSPQQNGGSPPTSSGLSVPTPGTTSNASDSPPSG